MPNPTGMFRIAKRTKRKNQTRRHGRLLRVESLERRMLLSVTPVEVAILTPNSPAGGEQFGQSVSVSGDTAVVGVPHDGAPPNQSSGSAYVYVRDNNGAWINQAQLFASDGASDDLFGESVSISGDTIVVQTVSLLSGPAAVSAVYVFVKPNGGWANAFEDAKLTASGAAVGEGGTVVVSGDTIVVGAFGATASSSGSAYVFTGSGATWTEQAKLTASDAAEGDLFGRGVAVSGDTIAVGAIHNDDAGSNSGSVYVFTGSGATWTERAKLTASDAAEGDAFGRGVAVSGDTIVVGAARNDDAGSNSGSAYVFTGSGAIWTERAKLTASDAAEGDQFRDVSVSGDTIVVGARLNDDAGSSSGSAYVFTGSGAIWTERAKLTASDAAEGDTFGHSVSVSGHTAVVAAHHKNGQAGGAYIYDLEVGPPVPDVSLLVDNADIAEDGGVATFLVTLSEVTTVPVTVDLLFTGTAASGDYTASGTQVVVAVGQTTGAVTVTAIDDSEDELDESVVVDIVSVIAGSEVGQQQQTTTIIDDDDPAAFRVISLVSTTTGFRAEFNNELDASGLNLYDTQSAGLGPADVILAGATTGVVVGSVVVDPSSRMITFIKTGGTLAADNYTVTLRSATDGFKNLAGDLLDGDGNGTAGGDFSDAFLVAGIDVNAITLSLPDFVRGPGQDVNLPADTTTGFPLSISEGTNVRAIDLQISYDPAMLDITGATVGENMPPGASVIVNTNTPGLLILVFFSATALPTGSSNFVNLQARVPAADRDGIYGKHQVLDVHSVTISDGNDNEPPVIADDALHLVSYLADVSGNLRINASDAAQVARVAALLDDGFVASPLTDPRIVGDISGNERINAADASLVARFAALIDVPEIPPIPTAIAAAGGADVGWFGSLVLPARQHDTQEDAETNLGERSTSTTRREGFPIHPALVDSFVEDRIESSVGAAEEEAAVVFEEALDEMFAGLDEHELLSE